MPGYPAPFIKFREDDANGNPLAGGKLFSYSAGTSTPLATYTSSTLATKNTNPVVLDASGRASVWVEDGVGYKFVLHDALDNVMWTEDNVQAPKVVPTPPSPVVPPGTIVAYGGTTAPAGWLLCDGLSVSMTTYPALYEAIKTTYGGAAGSGTFNVPDLRQKFPMGKAATGTGAALGNTGGAIDHAHSVPRSAWQPAPVTAADFPGYVQLASGGATVVNVPTGDGTSGTANPPYLTVNYMIKT